MTPDSYPRFSPVQAFRRVMMDGGATSHQLDTDSFVLEGFRDELTEYMFTLDDISLENGEAVVTVTMIRDGNSAIIDDNLSELFIGGESVDTSTKNPSSRGTDVTLRGPASGGEEVRYEFTTELFGGASATLTGTVPEPELEPIQAEAGQINVRGCDGPDGVAIGDTVDITVTLQNDRGGAENCHPVVNAIRQSTGDVIASAQGDTRGLFPDEFEQWSLTLDFTDVADFLAGSTMDLEVSAIRVTDAGASVDSTDVCHTFTLGEGQTTANIVVQDIMPPAQPEVGADVSATVVAENTGGQAGSRTYGVLLNGNRIGSVTFSLDPGESNGRGIGFTIQSAGTKTLRAGGQQATFEVPEPEPEFDPDAVDVPTDECNVTPQDVEPSEDVDLSATVRNRNEVPAAATVEWTWAGDQLATAGVNVPRNGAEVATATATIDREGGAPVRAEVISASESAASSVRAPAVEPVRAGASNEVGGEHTAR